MDWFAFALTIFKAVIALFAILVVGGVCGLVSLVLAMPVHIGEGFIPVGGIVGAAVMFWYTQAREDWYQ